jgi:hypothetical protein
VNSFDRLLARSARVLRSPAESGGVVGDLVVHQEHVACSDVYPVDGSLLDRVPQLAQYAKVWEIVAEDADVKVGDRLEVGGVRYPVHVVERWPWRGDGFYLRLVVQELQE